MFSAGLAAYFGRKRVRQRCNPLVAFTLNLLRKGETAAVPTDKDGGYCLMSKRYLMARIDSALDSMHYKCMYKTPSLAEDTVDEYIAISKSIAHRRDDPTLRRALLSGLHPGCLQHVYTRLLVTAKIHKQGEMRFRNIHNAAQSPFKPGMRYVSSLLRGFLRRLPHILKDSHHLTRILDGRTFPAGPRFYRFDIKDFYMSGAHATIIDCASRCIEQSDIKDFKDMTSFILGSQYVVSDPTSDICYDVRVGAGMGLISSSELSNATFYQLAEADFACCSEIQHRYGVHMYVRYEDDGFFIASGDRDLAVDFLQELKRRAQPFLVLAESVNSFACNMLDLRLWFGNLGNVLHQVQPKVTSIYTPLAPSSKHRDSVHVSWPDSMIKRAHSLCSNHSIARIAIQQLLDMWQPFGICVANRHHIDIFLTGLSSPRDHAHSFSLDHYCIGIRNVRLILEHNDVWPRTKLTKFLCQLNVAFASHGRGNFKFGIAWKLGGPHLVRKIQSLHDQMHVDHWRFSVYSHWRS